MQPKIKHRNTKQQKIILQALRNTTSHPTADQLFIEVRKFLPRISLATVYRNLSKLEEKGEVKSLELGGGQRRYDGNSKNHLHIRCRNCNRVADIQSPPPIASFTEKIKTMIEHDDYTVENCNLELIGLCNECKPNPQ